MLSSNNHVNFVLDSKSVVDRFNSNLVDSSELGCIIQACRQLFGCNFQNSHVEFNRRQANGVAHELARVAHLMLAPTFMMIYRHVSVI